MANSETKVNLWEQLRKPFDPKAVGKIPKGGIQLDYVGHAAVTDRLNNVVGPENWSLDPLSFNLDGSPLIIIGNTNAVMWSTLTILGTSKICVGTVKKTAYELEKEIIGDALRNGAMRFGVALDLWSKDELESNIAHPENKNIRPSYDPNEFPAETTRDIRADSKVTGTQLQNLVALVDNKGITEVADKATLLNKFAKSNFKADSIKDVTQAQADEIYTTIQTMDNAALLKLTEN